MLFYKHIFFFFPQENYSYSESRPSTLLNTSFLKGLLFLNSKLILYIWNLKHHTLKQQKKKKKQASKKKVQKQAVKKSSNNVFLGILFILAFVLYGNTLGHQYAFDDSIVITENAFTKKGFSGIGDLMTRDFFEGIYGKSTELTGGRYRPLSLAMFAVEYGIFGENPFIGHLINIVLYGLTLMLLFIVLQLCFNSKSIIPYITTLIFAVHPIHTEVIANIKSRDEILCFLFMLISMYALFKAIDTKELGKWMGIGIGSFFLALLAKETAITYLPVFPLFIYFFRQKSIPDGVIKGLYFIAPAVIYLLLRFALVGMPGGSDSSDIMENPYVNSSFNEKYASIFYVLLKYFGLLILPHPLTCDYSFNQIPFVGWSNIFVIISVLFYFGIGIYMLLKMKSRSMIALCTLLYLAPLSITSNFFFNIGAPMGERFLYIPSFGFCLLVAYGISKLLKVKELDDNWKSNYALIGLVGLILVTGSLRSVIRNFDWYDNFTLFAKDVETSSQSAKMQYYYGNINLKKYLADPTPENKQLLDIAERHFLKGLEINPKFHHCTYNLGNVYEQRDNAPKAIEYLNKTLEMYPTHINSHTLLGKVYGRLMKDYTKSVFYLEKAVNVFKEDSQGSLQNLGNAYAGKGDFPKALEIFQRLIKKDPNNARYYINMGITYDRMGDKVKANEAYQKARKIDPSLAPN